MVSIYHRTGPLDKNEATVTAVTVEAEKSDAEDSPIGQEALLQKLKVLNERLWENLFPRKIIERWLSNFADDVPNSPSERFHALFLLSHFTYFGTPQTRELLRALFRDLYRYPLVEDIRRSLDDTTDYLILEREFAKELAKTRFLGLGNPSESGPHLLYYFRQENDLPKSLFIQTHELFDRRFDARNVSFSNKDISRLVFLDDFCGSGDQAISYSTRVLDVLRDIAARESMNLTVNYFALIATIESLERIRDNSQFDDVKAVFELDESYRTFGGESRYFAREVEGITKAFAESMCRVLGKKLFPSWPLGYKESQLLLGFRHNIPDNTLPIFWSKGNLTPWFPIFRRYDKKYE